MNQELTKKLCEDFPQIFQDTDKPPQQSLMCFGIECDDGWFQLIYDLCTKIMELKPHDGFRASQIKEKFGTLRFYVTTASDEIWDVIEKAEDESAKICEECGSRRNVTQSGGWVRTLCSNCRWLREIKRQGLYIGDDEVGVLRKD